jgi:hypothetical protein
MSSIVQHPTARPWIFQSTKISNYLLKLKVLEKKKDNCLIGETGGIMGFSYYLITISSGLILYSEINNIFAGEFQLHYLF